MEQRNGDRFTQLMFGRRAEAKEEEESILETETSNIDYEKLMENIDVLMNVYDQIKPGLSKLNPLLAKWLTKDR
ncbi:hypothetical protein [Bacillus sp. V59.32b]|uniref:hypothetical protein n=1 Tax=Bacillus sp. V59.32b TaxID=1758642 RepID=UPI000E3D40CD|nr:hypothetical protein [Bacillus sp. V59.32b]RFU63037.1 hypothetical protein D0463_12300 [Bacillus sp. V59.32b]